ncbi:MAG: dicarboxylate/amino acid:cation symporter [Bacteroidales bacterium]|nr:dicarboxylate/amino acid:cation symporter [Bacteroidales bacterium]
MKLKIPLLLKIVIAILLGVLCSLFFPTWLIRFFVTLNVLFGNLLGFIIPLLILGLVAPGIAELGKGAGKMLGVTTLIAYGSTVLAGLFSYYICKLSYPSILNQGEMVAQEFISDNAIEPYFTVDMPAVFGVTTALILAFVLGLTMIYIKGTTMKNLMFDLREIIIVLINKVIIPILPIYIFSIFLKMGGEGVVVNVMSLFIKVIAVIFVMHVLLLLVQFIIAGAVARKNPFVALKNMLPAYFTALGTQSSAATIPVTLACAKKNGISDNIADFVIPLCATIHMSGSILKIVACAFAIAFMTGMPTDIGTYIEFIMLLGITMVASPGVPGGAIMAALGVIASVLGFDANLQGLMIALYIAMDSFGTACNITGDGAISMIVNRIFAKG